MPCPRVRRVIRRRTRGGKQTGIVDYSRVGLTVNEGSLNERLGFPGVFGTWADGMLTLSHCSSGVRQRRTLRTGPTDFNCDGNPRGGAVPPVDINGDGDIGVLQGQNDWDNLTFDGGAVGSLDVAPDLPTTTTVREPPIGKLMGLARALETGSSGPGGRARRPAGGGRAAGAALALPRMAVTRMRCRSAQPCRGVVKLVARVVVKRVVGRRGQRRVIRLRIPSRR